MNEQSTTIQRVEEVSANVLDKEVDFSVQEDQDKFQRIVDRFVAQLGSSWIDFLNGRAETNSLKAEFLLIQIKGFVQNIISGEAKREVYVAAEAEAQAAEASAREDFA